MLGIGDNSISSLDSLKFLKGLKDLEMLNCDDTLIASDAKYSKVAF
jgi:hypothetical protein